MRNVYSVSQVNSYIKNMFAQDYMLRSITVSGEVSNVKYHSSGHIYFTMKDKGGAISCVMFASYTKKLNFRLTEGLLVESSGSVTVYERDGKYQLYAIDIKKAGAGALYEKYEALKAELQEMGMFDEQYKKPIPKYSKRIGIVTASTGAAIQDIMQISHRRNPYVQLYLYPAQVQGEGAKESIVAGIKALENFGVDVMIVGRGGGSIEDLWAFNERCVAEAIFNCGVPVISAVGHESDTTIADYVADLRAPTPSAAAELAVFSYDEFMDNVSLLKSSLDHYMRLCIASKRTQTQRYADKIESASPQNRLKEKRMMASHLSDRLNRIMQQCISQNRQRVLIDIERLKALNPADRLSRGYALVTGPSGKAIKSTSEAKIGDDITLNLKDGVIEATINSVTTS